jgi:hypothetical protein
MISRGVAGFVLLLSFTLALPARDASAAPGVCTALSGGNVCAAAYGGIGCDDDPADGCPDADDLLEVAGQTIHVDRDLTIARLLNSIANGQIHVAADRTFTVTAVATGDTWACATCAFGAEPGARVRIGADPGAYAALSSGALTLAGTILHTGTISSVGFGGGTLLTIHFNGTLAEAVRAGDLLKITSGLAKGYTFEIISVPTATSVIVDSSRRDPAQDSRLSTATPGAGALSATFHPGSADYIASDDQAYLGKFVTDGSKYVPIVRFDAGAGELDVVHFFYPIPFDPQGGLRMAYGFEAGRETAEILRPVRVETGNGNNAYLSLLDGSRTTIRYADFEGIGVALGEFAGDIDNANRPAEFLDIADSSFHDYPVAGVVPIQLHAFPSSEARNLVLDGVEIYGFDSEGINLTGQNLTLRNFMIRDQISPTGDGIGVAGTESGTSGRIVIEDGAILRTAQGVAAGSPSSRPDVTVRRIWAVGKGRQQAGMGGIVFSGTTISPFDKGATRNSINERLFNSVIYGHGNAEFSVPGASIGQNVPAVNSVLAWSLDDNGDGMYRGDSYYSVLTRNSRHGQTACTHCVGNITSLNKGIGLASSSEYCTFAICTNTPFDRRLIGNLSFGNGREALGHQEVNRASTIRNNTLVAATGLGYQGAVFNPSADPIPTASNPAIACFEGNPDLEDCGAASGQRPPWWIAAPDAQPDVTFKDNIVGNSFPVSAISFAGARFAAADLRHTFNYYFLSLDPDLDGFVPLGQGEADNQPDPFVDLGQDDYRLNASIPGSDGATSMGAGFAGVLADPESMPPIYANLVDGGVKTVFRGGDLPPVDPDLDGKVQFLSYSVKRKRISFGFASLPPCPDPNTCATLKLILHRSDGATRTASGTVPVRLSTQEASAYTVHEDAVPLLFSGIEDFGQLELYLVIGGTESAHDTWPMLSRPFKARRYVVRVRTPK